MMCYRLYCIIGQCSEKRFKAIDPTMDCTYMSKNKTGEHSPLKKNYSPLSPAQTMFDGPTYIPCNNLYRMFYVSNTNNIPSLLGYICFVIIYQTNLVDLLVV